MNSNNLNYNTISSHEDDIYNNQRGHIDRIRYYQDCDNRNDLTGNDYTFSNDHNPEDVFNNCDTNDYNSYEGIWNNGAHNDLMSDHNNYSETNYDISNNIYEGDRNYDDNRYRNNRNFNDKTYNNMNNNNNKGYNNRRNNNNFNSGERNSRCFNNSRIQHEYNVDKRSFYGNKRTDDNYCEEYNGKRRFEKKNNPYYKRRVRDYDDRRGCSGVMERRGEDVNGGNGGSNYTSCDFSLKQELERVKKDLDANKSASLPQTSCSTVYMARLPDAVSEKEIEDNLRCYSLKAKDIRIVRKQEAGSNRGIAFIDFYCFPDAEEWVEKTKGLVSLVEGLNSMLSFSRHNVESGVSHQLESAANPERVEDTLLEPYKGDWKCVKCGCINFRRREKCFKCQLKRNDTDYDMRSQDGSDFIGLLPSETMLVMGLKKNTSEANIKQMIFNVTRVTVKDLFVVRDNVDRSMTCFGFIWLFSTTQSLTILNSIRSSFPINIDGVAVQFNYSKTNFLNVKVLLSHRGFDIRSLNDHGVKETQQHEHLQPHLKQPQKLKDSILPTNTRHLPAPDSTRYVYDEPSGYYYDPVIKLYYDVKSQYFYDAEKGIFLYWEGSQELYVEVNDHNNNLNDTNENKLNQNIINENINTNNTDEKKKKVEINRARKVTQDMEKWAKQQNIKKESLAISSTTSSSLCSSSSLLSSSSSLFKKPILPGFLTKKAAAADAGFNLLNKAVKRKVNIKVENEKNENILSSLVDSYGSGSEDEEGEETGSGKKRGVEEEDSLEQIEERFTDWSKKACLLCKRIFNTFDMLKKHKVLSDLHKINLEKHRAKLQGKVIPLKIMKKL